MTVSPTIEEIQALTLPGDPNDFPVVTTPDIAATPPTLDFGGVADGALSTLSTTVSNVGTADLTIDNVTINGSVDFGFVPPGPLVVVPGGSVPIAVDYMPSLGGTQNGSLVIRSNDSDEDPFIIALSGRGIECDIDVNPLSLSFPAYPDSLEGHQ